MPSKAMGGEIGVRDEESKGSESKRGWEGNADEANETVKAMMASKSGGEGECGSNNTTDNTNTGEGSKRKTKLLRRPRTARREATGMAAQTTLLKSRNVLAARNPRKRRKTLLISLKKSRKQRNHSDGFQPRMTPERRFWTK